MLLRIMFFLLLVLVISLGIHWVSSNNGTVEFVWLDYHVKTTVAFTLVFLVLLFVLLTLAMELISGIISLPSKINKKFKGRKQEQLLLTLQSGYAALLSGDIDAAEKASRKLLAAPAESKSIDGMTRMLAAKVAQERGELRIAQDHYKTFLDDKEHKFFAVKGMLDSAFLQGDTNEAIQYAESAYRLKPNVKDGAHSLLELYKNAGRLESAERFLRKYKRRHIFRKDAHNNIDVNREFFDIKLQQAKTACENAGGFMDGYAKARHLLDKALSADPNNKEGLMLMLRICKDMRDRKKAQNTIEKAWPQARSLELGLAYLEVIGSTATGDATKKKLRAIERLNKIRPDAEMADKLKDKVYA